LSIELEARGARERWIGLIPTRRDLLLSILCTACGLVLLLVIHGLTGRTAPLLSFFPAFIVAARYGQRIAGLLAVGLATAVLAAYWLGSTGWLVLVRLDAVSLALFAALGLIIVLSFNRSAQVVRALQTTEQRFRVALEGSSITAWTCDEEGRYTWLYNLPPGIDAGAILGKRIGEANPADQYPEFIAAVERVWQSGQGERLPVTWTHQGMTRHYFMTLDAIKDASGRVKGLVGASMDVTSLHDAQRATARARNELQAVADLMASGVALYGRDLRYRWASRRYLEWVGKSAEEVIGHSIIEVVGPSLFELKHPYIERVLAGESVTFEHEVEMPVGHRSWVHIAYTPSRDAGDVIDGWVGVVTDITERRKIEEALREADQRKDEFLATLAHELRNPMAAIRYAARLLQPDAPAATLEKARGAIERQSIQMSRLLDGLLDVSRITRNVIELKPEELELRATAQEAIDTTRPLIEEARHQLVVSMPPEPLWVRADPARLLQIFGNLLSNAAKYTPPGGEVRVTLEPEGELARISIRDTGVGLSEEMLPKVFDLFAQVHKGLNVSATGLGIGLAVTKRLTELHGGRIEVRSEGLGRGAEFLVYLPRTAPPAQQVSIVDKVVTLFQGEPRVLVVDDNRDAADTLAVLLRSRGLNVHVAYDGKSALELAEAARPTLVVLDVGLPDVSGLEVAQALRRAAWAAQIMIIAVTGWGQPADRLKTRNAGFDAHLVKPVDPDELFKLIHSAPHEPSEPSPSSRTA
jgi:PAS domain S-box-containing protein